MKTMILATAAVLGIGIGSAFAGDGEGGTIPNTYFTDLPGVVAQAPVQQFPSALAANQHAATTNAFVTGRSRAVSLFPPNSTEGTQD
jgi:hypothetical protein